MDIRATTQNTYVVRVHDDALDHGDEAEITVYATAVDVAKRKGARSMGVSPDKVSVRRTHVRGRAA